MYAGKQALKKDDLEAFARKLRRQIGGMQYGGNGQGGPFPAIIGEDHEITVVQNVGEISLGVDPQLELTASTEQPYLKITNQSDTERDPVVQWAVGATPVTKYTAGVDDSQQDKWVLAAGAEFSAINNIIEVLDTSAGDYGLVEFQFIEQIGTPAGQGPGMCTDGSYIYCSTSTTGLAYIIKYDFEGNEIARTTGAYVNNAFKLCVTDGGYVYVVGSTATINIYKFLCSDMSFDSVVSMAPTVSDSPIYGLFYISGQLLIAYGGGSFFGLPVGIAKLRCMDLGVEWNRSWAYGTGDLAARLPIAVTTDGAYIYVLDSGASGSHNRIIRLNPEGYWIDHYNLPYPALAHNQAFWTAGPFIYAVLHYGTNDERFVKWDRDNLATPIDNYDVATGSSYVYSAFYLDGFHYTREQVGAAYSLNKYQYSPVGATDASSFVRIKLNNYYDFKVDVAAFTGDGRLGVGTFFPAETIDAIGNVRAAGGQFISTIGIGTAPLVVASATVCTNLNADMVDGLHSTSFVQVAISATDPPGINDDVDNYREGCIWVEQDADAIWFCADNANGAAVWHGLDQDLRAADGPSFNHVHLTVATGTAPMVVTSTTKVSNLNADLLDGNEAAAFALSGHNHDAAYSPLGHTHALDDLSDVDAAAPDDGDALTWVAAHNAWEPVPAGAGAAAFLDLTDVDEADYMGHAGEFVVVNGTEDGLVFSASSAAAHDLLSVTHGDTAASAVSRGSIIVGDSTPKWAELAVGDAGQVLKTDGTDVFWDDPPAASAHALLSATHDDTTADGVERGDIIIGSGASPTWARLSKGTAGYILTMGANEPAWAAPAAASEHCWMRETFDGLSNGDIIGQGSYTELSAWADQGMAAGSTAVVGAHPVSGKMLTVTNKAAAGATNSYVGCTVSTSTFFNGGGRIHFKFKINQNGSGYGGRIAILDTADAQPFNIYFRYSTTFQIADWNGAGVKIMDASKDTWYTVDAYWKAPGASAGQVMIFINGAYAYKGATGTMSTAWNRITVSSYSPAGGADCALDVDDLFVYSELPLGAQ